MPEVKFLSSGKSVGVVIMTEDINKTKIEEFVEQSSNANNG